MPTALVLSAGGMFAAWEAGVWIALRDHVQFDLIVGASAGAWVGWCIACGMPPEDLVRRWKDPAAGHIMRVGLHRSGWLRHENLHERARELAALGPPRIPFALTLVQIPPLRLTLARDGEIGWRHLAATCSIPLSFPPVDIDGRSWVDGGLLGALPVWAAEQLGATRAVAVNCLTNLPFRMMRAIVRPRRPSPGFDVSLIEPQRALGSLYDAVFWKSTNIERWIDQGIEDGKRALTSGKM